jgi:hypothetical protein
MKHLPALTPRFLIVPLSILNIPLPLSRSIKSAGSGDIQKCVASPSLRPFLSMPSVLSLHHNNFLFPGEKDGEIACIRKRG